MHQFRGYFTGPISSLIGPGNVITILDSVFFSISNTDSNGGAVECCDRAQFTCTNTHFIACKTNQMGGAVFTNNNSNSTIARICCLGCFALSKAQTLYMGNTITGGEMVTSCECASYNDFEFMPSGSKDGVIYFDGSSADLSSLNTTHSFVSSLCGFDCFTQTGELKYSLFLNNSATGIAIGSIAAPDSNTHLPKNMIDCCLVHNTISGVMMGAQNTYALFRNLVCSGNVGGVQFLTSTTQNATFVKSQFDFDESLIQPNPTRWYTVTECVFKATASLLTYRFEICFAQTHFHHSNIQIFIAFARQTFITMFIHLTYIC